MKTEKERQKTNFLIWLQQWLQQDVQYGTEQSARAIYAIYTQHCDKNQIDDCLSLVCFTKLLKDVLHLSESKAKTTLTGRVRMWNIPCCAIASGYLDHYVQSQMKPEAEECKKTLAITCDINFQSFLPPPAQRKPEPRYNCVILASAEQQIQQCMSLLQKTRIFRKLLVLFPVGCDKTSILLPYEGGEVRSMTWYQASQCAYRHECSVYDMGEMARLLAARTWMWEDRFDLIVIRHAEQMTKIYYLFLTSLMNRHDVKPCLWFLGEGSWKICTRPSEGTSIPNSRYLLLAPQLFADVNHFQWELYNLLPYLKSISQLTEVHTTPFIEQLGSTVREELLPSFPPISCPNDRYTKLFGVSIPQAYKNHGTNLREIFGISGLRHEMWRRSTYLPHAQRFNAICSLAKNNTPLSLTDRAFLYLCAFVDETRGVQSLLDTDLKDTDWLSEPLQQASAHFDAIGLHDQEREVRKDHFRGRIDGLTTEGAVVELKFWSFKRFEHKLQVMLYHCMLHQERRKDLTAREPRPTYCVLFNYRTGEISRLTCTNSTEDFFQHAIQLCGLTGHDRDFLALHK